MKVPILLYHSVSPRSPAWIAPWTVTPSQFNAHLAAIRASERQPLTVSQYVAGLRGFAVLPQRPVLITFDDGFADFAEFAQPALGTWDLVSTLYVTTGALAGQRHRNECVLPSAPMLSPADLRDLEAVGVEIGGHSHTHRQMDLLSARQIADEVYRCQDLLSDWLGHSISSFAYPHGYWRSQVRKLAGEAGFDSACAVGEAFSGADDHPFSLSRLTVKSHTSAEEIGMWLNELGAETTTARRRVLAYGWRQVRRFQPRRRS